MNVEVIPLTRQSVNWDDFLKASRIALGRNITSVIDRKKLPLGRSDSFITAMGEMKIAGEDTIQNAGPVLDHIFYSFMIIADMITMFDLMEQTPLKVYSVEAKNGIYLAVVSGTLMQWRESILNGCSKTATYEMRLIMDKCMYHLEKDGLSKIWSDYRKTMMKDKTFFLETK